MYQKQREKHYKDKVMTQYNDINTYNYSVKPYAYGWMVYHIENGTEVMDMCYAKEDVAKSAAMSMNMREAKRVADAKERIERFNNTYKAETLENYYGVANRYYGD